VRILLTSSLGGVGHLTPIVAAARASLRLGHDALVLVPPSLADRIERTGIPFRVGHQPSKAFVDEIWTRVRAGAPEADGLIDRELFADRATRAMLGPFRAARDTWQPDLVVREPCEYASAVAAPYLSSFPASLDPSPWAITLRFRTAAPVVGELPEWWRGGERPLVYVSFGTVIGHLPEANGVYRSVLDAVSGLPVRVLITVGQAVDIDRLGPIPANTHVEQWLPQADVLAHAALVVCHGGSGTTFGALAAGVPLVICPLFADQPVNAQLVQAAGAGLAVVSMSDEPSNLRSLGAADVAPLREAIQQVLGEPAYRRAAERIGAEMAATPTLEDVIDKYLAKP